MPWPTWATNKGALKNNGRRIAPFADRCACPTSPLYCILKASLFSSLVYPRLPYFVHSYFIFPCLGNSFFWWIWFPSPANTCNERSSGTLGTLVCASLLSASRPSEKPKSLQDCRKHIAYSANLSNDIPILMDWKRIFPKPRQSEQHATTFVFVAVSPIR